MALIKCPECGKEISDKALECPQCGYKINDRKNINNNVEDEPSGVGLIVGITSATIMILWGILVLLSSIESLTHPEDPDAFVIEIFCCFIVWLPSCLPLVIYAIVKRIKNMNRCKEVHGFDEMKKGQDYESKIKDEKDSNGIMYYRPVINWQIGFAIFFGMTCIIWIIIGDIPMLLLSVCMTVICFWIGYDKLKEKQRIFDECKDDPQKYEKEIMKHKEIEKAQSKIAIEMLKNNGTKNVGVKCPYCNSTNVKKIGNVNRVASVAMVGIASSKIGKQWHCNNCKSDF